MGQVLHKWKRQKSSKEALEVLESVLKKLKQRHKVTQQWEKTVIGLLLIFFLFTYPVLIGGGVVCYIWFPGMLSVGVLTGYLFVLVILPVLCYAMWKALVMCFEHRKSQYDLAVETLIGERRKVLDEVMEKEPYNIARELLEKYDPTHPSLVPATPQPAAPRPASQSAVRHRRPTPAPPTIHPAHHFARGTGFAPVPGGSRTPLHSTVPHPQGPTPGGPARHSYELISPGHCMGSAPGPPAPVPILPRERSNFDKVVEYLVGDGPSNRYALICTQCHSHNGMALKDQFPYLTFRCAYCYYLNPAREKRPSTTASEPVTTPVRQQTSPQDGNQPTTIDEDEDEETRDSQ